MEMGGGADTTAEAAAAWSFMASNDASILFWPTTRGDAIVFDSCSMAAPDGPEGEVKTPPLGLPATPPIPAAPLFEAATAASSVGECASGGSLAMDASSAAVLCREAPPGAAPLGWGMEKEEVLACTGGCWGVKGAAGGFTVTGPMAVMEREAEEGLRERAKGVAPPPTPLPLMSSPRESRADSTSPFWAMVMLTGPTTLRFCGVWGGGGGAWSLSLSISASSLSLSSSSSPCLPPPSRS